MNDSANNPYTAPESNVNNNVAARSALPKVIGIISIILGILTVLGGAFNAFMGFASGGEGGMMGMPMDPNIMKISGIVGLITGIWAIWIGVKLLKYQDSGRKHFNYYTIFNIIIAIAMFFVTKGAIDKMLADMGPEMQEAMGGTMMMSSMSGFIAPIILIIVALLLNGKNVKASLN